MLGLRGPPKKPKRATPPVPLARVLIPTLQADSFRETSGTMATWEGKLVSFLNLDRSKGRETLLAVERSKRAQDVAMVVRAADLGWCRFWTREFGPGIFRTRTMAMAHIRSLDHGKFRCGCSCRGSPFQVSSKGQPTECHQFGGLGPLIIFTHTWMGSIQRKPLA